MNKRKRKCWKNTKNIANTFQNLEFTVHSESQFSFYATQQIGFMESEINSVSMTITLTNDKTENFFAPTF